MWSLVSNKRSQSAHQEERRAIKKSDQSFLEVNISGTVPQAGGPDQAIPADYRLLKRQLSSLKDDYQDLLVKYYSLRSSLFKEFEERENKLKEKYEKAIREAFENQNQKGRLFTNRPGSGTTMEETERERELFMKDLSLATSQGSSDDRRELLQKIKTLKLANDKLSLHLTAANKKISHLEKPSLSQLSEKRHSRDSRKSTSSGIQEVLKHKVESLGAELDKLNNLYKNETGKILKETPNLFQKKTISRRRDKGQRSDRDNHQIILQPSLQTDSAKRSPPSPLLKKKQETPKRNTPFKEVKEKVAPKDSLKEPKKIYRSFYQEQKAHLDSKKSLGQSGDTPRFISALGEELKSIFPLSANKRLKSLEKRSSAKKPPSKQRNRSAEASIHLKEYRNYPKKNKDPSTQALQPSSKTVLEYRMSNTSFGAPIKGQTSSTRFDFESQRGSSFVNSNPFSQQFN